MRAYPFDPIPNLLDTLILLALKSQPRHGYEIETLVINSSQARLNLWGGSIYKALRRLAKEAYITPLEGKEPRGQVYYQLTDEGWRFLSREIGVLRYIIRLYDRR